jgi:hypothetical protein
MGAMEDGTHHGVHDGRDGPRDGSGGWAVPGSAVAQPAVADAPPAVATAGPGPDPAAGDGATPPAPSVPGLALRPMTVADVLDGGFAVLKARPRRLLGVAAAFVVPSQLLVAYIGRQVSGGLEVADVFSGDPAVLDQSNSDLGAQYLTIFAAVILSGLALVCVAAAVAHQVSQWMMGRDAPAGELFGVVGRRILPLSVSFVLVKLAEVAGLFGCYIAILFVMALFVVVAPVIAVEGVGPFAALGRSSRLVQGRYFPVLGLAVLMGIVGLLLSNALAALPQALAIWIDSPATWPLLAVGGVVAEVIVVPFTAAATTLLYLDLRVRNEGLDIEMTARHVLDGPA